MAVKWRRDVDLRPMSKVDSIWFGDLTYRLKSESESKKKKKRKASIIKVRF